MRRRRPTRVLVPVAALAAVLTAAAPAAASSGPAPGHRRTWRGTRRTSPTPTGGRPPPTASSTLHTGWPTRRSSARSTRRSCSPRRPPRPGRRSTPGMLVPGWNAGNPYRASGTAPAGTSRRSRSPTGTGRCCAATSSRRRRTRATRTPAGRCTGPYPGVVITTGSVQGSEHMYWWLAEDLAERGYVVLAYDVQGQGTSETLPHRGPVADLPVLRPGRSPGAGRGVAVPGHAVPADVELRLRHRGRDLVLPLHAGRAVRELGGGSAPVERVQPDVAAVRPLPRPAPGDAGPHHPAGDRRSLARRARRLVRAGGRPAGGGRGGAGQADDDGRRSAARRRSTRRAR